MKRLIVSLAALALLATMPAAPAVAATAHACYSPEHFAAHPKAYREGGFCQIAVSLNSALVYGKSSNAGSGAAGSGAAGSSAPGSAQAAPPTPPAYGSPQPYNSTSCTQGGCYTHTTPPPFPKDPNNCQSFNECRQLEDRT